MTAALVLVLSVAHLALAWRIHKRGIHERSEQ